MSTHHDVTCMACVPSAGNEKFIPTSTRFWLWQECAQCNNLLVIYRWLIVRHRLHVEGTRLRQGSTWRAHEIKQWAHGLTIRPTSSCDKTRTSEWPAAISFPCTGVIHILIKYETKLVVLLKQLFVRVRPKTCKCEVHVTKHTKSASMNILK